MIKKILAGIAIAGLMAGTGCGVYYGFKYNNELSINNSQNQTSDISGLKSNIIELKETIASLTLENQNLNSEINMLKANNNTLSSQIDGLNQIKAANEQTISDLNNSIASNNNTIAELNISIENLQEQITQLESSNEDKSAEIEALTADINNLQELKKQLEETNDTNTETITSLNNQIAELNNQIDILNVEINDKSTEIEDLTANINNLQTLKNQLEETNNINTETIASLNSQITELNNQIDILSAQTNDNAKLIETYENRIDELETSIATYEKALEDIKSDTQISAIYEFNNSVISINLVTQGSAISIPDPESTERVIFNGWTVNGEKVDPSTYIINEDTVFVADVIYKNNVKFMDNATEINSSFYTSEETIVVPEAPVKAGYNFVGWTVDQINVINPETYTATEDLIFYAKYVKVHTITYTVGENTYTETVEDGKYANGLQIDLAENTVFNGWLYNNSIIDLETTPITYDMILVADIRAMHTVSFMLDGEEYATEKVAADSLVTAPAKPSKVGLGFAGWTIDGTTVVDLKSYTITENTTFTAKFGNYALQTISTNFNSYGFTSYGFWNDGKNIYYSSGTSDQYVYDFETNTFVLNEWYGQDFTGQQIWHDGDNIYYSNNDIQYKLNKETRVWETMTWNGLTSFKGFFVWTDGVDKYYSSGGSNYILNRSTNTWESISITGASNVSGAYIWNYKDSTFLSTSSKTYLFNKDNRTWTATTWTGGKPVDGINVFTDGVNAFYASMSGENFMYDMTTYTQIEATPFGNVELMGYTATVIDGVTYIYNRYVGLCKLIVV